MVKGAWSLDKRIPVAIIIMIAVQTITAVWWTAKRDSAITANTEKIEAVNVRVATLEKNGELLIRIDERLKYLSDKMDGRAN